MLIAADIGNVNTKFRVAGGAWTIEPSLVRLAGAGGGYLFDDADAGRQIKPLIYLSGPGQIDAVPYLVGSDAQAAGGASAAAIGSAELRVHSTPYLLLHLYAILASLPSGTTRATVAFAGGLPVGDGPEVAEALRRRLTGRRAASDPALTHALQWGDQVYELTIDKVLLVPQPIGALATYMYDQHGQVIGNGALLRRRYVLDIGGGTTDYTGREGLKLIPGTEGGVPFGVATVAAHTRDLITAKWPSLKQTGTEQLLEKIRANRPTIHVAGEPQSIAPMVKAATTHVADQILADVLPRWGRELAQGEVLIVGGGGQVMVPSIGDKIGRLTRVTLMPDPIIRVAEGLERLGRSKLG